MSVHPFYLLALSTKSKSLEWRSHRKKTAEDFCFDSWPIRASMDGRYFFHKWAANGYMDLDLDDFEDSSLYAEIQTDQMKGAPVEEGLFLQGRW
jgi:hypothetical protein